MNPTDDLIASGARARARAKRSRVDSLLGSGLAPKGWAYRDVGRSLAVRRPGFTRLMAADADVIPQLDEIIAWLGDIDDADIAFEVPPIEANEPLHEALARRGFYQRRVQAVLGRDVSALDEADELPAGVEVRAPRTDELEAYMRTFTEGFSSRNDWDEDDRRQREREMIHEFADARYWTLLLATVDGEHAGIATLWVDGDLAFFSNGATVAKHRGKGVHAALIQARLRAAANAGARTVYVDTHVSSVADRNLHRHGFELLCHLGMWHRLPEAKA